MHPELDPTYYGLSIWDLDREFLSELGGGVRRLPLSELLSVLRDAYCRTVGIEYGHVLDPEQKRWIRERVEGVDEEVSADDQRWILERLNAAEAFESFLHTKYVGQKRFGLEGAESLIPLLDALCESAADDDDVTDIVMGMAHRGRLNVLSNILGKSHRQIFGEFEGHIDPDTVQGSGDVKYHLGSAGTYTARSGATVDLHLPPNPSHLEAVNPVVEGIARAMQDRMDRGHEGVFPVLPVLMHGDSAFAGQGVVVETLHLSQLRGYRTGGTIHVVINNQVGFTTSPEASRSSFYATDVAKTVQAPILHVNGDDPEAVVRVARLACEYRAAFHRDIVIDLVCYRRHGHNEADDPSFTQPEMYGLIREHRSTRKLYTERLVRRGDISIEQAERFLEDYESRLELAFDETRQAPRPRSRSPSSRSNRACCRHRDRRRTRPPRSYRRRAVRGARRFHPPPQARPHLPAGARPLRSRARSTGRWARRSRSAPCCSRGTTCAWPARTRGAGPSPTVTPSRSTSTPARSTSRWRTSHPSRAAGSSTTRCSRSTPRSASSTATRQSPTTPWCAGRRSSATSSTARRSSSTSSSSRPRTSGPDLRPRAAAAARLRGAGAGALVGTHRAVPDPQRRGQHPGGQRDHLGAVLPRTAASAAPW
jgi:hypothetical protein